MGLAGWLALAVTPASVGALPLSLAGARWRRTQCADAAGSAEARFAQLKLVLTKARRRNSTEQSAGLAKIYFAQSPGRLPFPALLSGAACHALSPT